MARKITIDAINAFMAGQKFNRDNTCVYTTFESNGETVWNLSLHGNRIAMRKGKEISISNAGWQSNTTKERLNGIPGVRIHQKNYQWFLNNEAWDGEWKKI